MSRHETEQASADRHSAEGHLQLFAQQEGKCLIAEGMVLLPLPLVVQFAGDLIAQFGWGIEILLFLQLLLIFGAIIFWGQHRFWSMAVLACTYLAVPAAWRYVAANAGCCLVMIGAGWALLRRS